MRLPITPLKQMVLFEGIECFAASDVTRRETPNHCNVRKQNSKDNKKLATSAFTVFMQFNLTILLLEAQAIDYISLQYMNTNIHCKNNWIYDNLIATFILKGNTFVKFNNIYVHILSVVSSVIANEVFRLYRLYCLEIIMFFKNIDDILTRSEILKKVSNPLFIWQQY